MSCSLSVRELNTTTTSIIFVSFHRGVDHQQIMSFAVLLQVVLAVFSTVQGSSFASMNDEGKTTMMVC